MSKVITSEFFENLQYTIYSNGGHASLLNDTNVLGKDRAYSAMELFPDNPVARVGMMFELRDNLVYLEKGSYYNALIEDAKYNLNSFNNSIETLRHLATYDPDNVKIFTFEFIGFDCLENVFTKSLKDAKTLANIYAKLKGVELLNVLESKNNLDHLKQHFRRVQRDNRTILSKAVSKENKTLFKLPEPFGVDIPFKDLHIWSYLESIGFDGTQSNLDVIHDYLRSLGFNQGLHYLENVKCLRYALNYYYEASCK